MTATPLRPRSATEIVDASFRVLRQSYLQLAAVAAVILLPYIIVVVVMGANPADVPRVLGFSVLLGICAAVVEGAIVVAVSESYLNGTTRVAEALASAAKRLPGLIGVAILRGLVVGFGVVAVVLIPGIAAGVLLRNNIPAMVVVLFLLALAPAVYLVLRTLFMTAVLMLEQTGVGNSFKRSWHLAGGQMWRVLLTMLLAWVIYIGLFVVLSLAVNLLLTRNPTVSAVLSAIVMCFAYPFVGVVTTLLYYDLRVRKEGFDLELMTEQLAAG
ncbi:MAG: hypothetical protein ACREOJ_18955 [Gemmatimonadaceae bacterium]